MLKPLFALTGAALLLGACETTQTATAPPPSPPPAQVTSYMVFFDWDRSDLSSQAMATMQQAAGTFKNGGQSRVTAVGYTDTSGPRDYNMALSLRRSNTFKTAMVQQGGVPSDAVVATGRGEDGLLVPTADGVREPQNRRVEIAMGTGQASMEIFRDPASYCRALMDKYREYRRGETREVAAVATYRCEQGNYAEGIPQLEDGLIKAKIPLPAPGYRWPGKSYAPS